MEGNGLSKYSALEVWGRDGEGWEGRKGEEWTSKWECPEESYTAAGGTLHGDGEGHNLETDGLLIRGPACFQISLIFWFHPTNLRLWDPKVRVGAQIFSWISR